MYGLCPQKFKFSGSGADRWSMVDAGEAFVRQWEQLTEKERESFGKSLDPDKNAVFVSALRFLSKINDNASDIHKSLEPVRQAVYSILQQPGKNLLNSGLNDSQNSPDENESLEPEFSPSQAGIIASAISVGLVKHSENLVRASQRSDDISIKSLAVSVEANRLARWAFVIAIVGAFIASGWWARLLCW